MPRRKRYRDETISDKKLRLKNEMDKYIYFDKKIKQLTLIEENKDEKI